MHDVCIYFRRFHKIYLSTNIKNVPRINTLKQELSSAKRYEHNRLDETSVVDMHRCHMAAKFGVFVDEDHSKLPMLYVLPKLHKGPYKSCFIVNSSSCTTTKLSSRLTSCLTVIKSQVFEKDFRLSLSDNNQTDIIEAFNSTSRY